MALEQEALHKTLEESQKKVKKLDLCLKHQHTKVEEARYWGQGSVAVASNRQVAQAGITLKTDQPVFKNAEHLSGVCLS